MKKPRPTNPSPPPPGEALTLQQALEIIQELRQQIVQLKAENRKLKDRLAKNSRNSSKPPLK